MAKLNTAARMLQASTSPEADPNEVPTVRAVGVRVRMAAQSANDNSANPDNDPPATQPSAALLEREDPSVVRLADDIGRVAMAVDRLVRSELAVRDSHPSSSAMLPVEHSYLEALHRSARTSSEKATHEVRELRVTHIPDSATSRLAHLACSVHSRLSDLVDNGAVAATRYDAATAGKLEQACAQAASRLQLAHLLQVRIPSFAGLWLRAMEGSARRYLQVKGPEVTSDREVSSQVRALRARPGERQAAVRAKGDLLDGIAAQRIEEIDGGW